MITQENKDTLNSYAKLKNEIKFLETKAEELNPLVLDIMNENEVEEIAINELGKLCIGARRKWDYTVAVKELEKKP